MSGTYRGNGSLDQGGNASRAAAGAVTQTMNDATVGEATNPLEPFFGPIRGTHMSLRADDSLSHETYNLPEAYKGRNKRLEDVLDFMIREEDEFYTRYLLPWEFTDELHVNWEVFRFNRTLADVEPHQGVPRLVTAESEARTENLIRRGLAFIIEHGFYKTERGRRHFMLNLQQIADAVHITCNFGVMHALLSGNNYYKEWERKFGDNSGRRREVFAQERRRWALIQKEERGLEILDAEVKHNMRLNGVTPNIWVLPSKASIYLNLVRDEKVHYDKAGPEGPARLKDATSKLQQFRGVNVVEAAPFDIDFSNEHVELLHRTRMCGEWFVMEGVRRTAAAGAAGVPAEQAGDASDIQIYDADLDKFVKITWADALKHCGNLENKTVTAACENEKLILDADYLGHLTRLLNLFETPEAYESKISGTAAEQRAIKRLINDTLKAFRNSKAAVAAAGAPADVAALAAINIPAMIATIRANILGQIASGNNTTTSVPQLERLQSTILKVKQLTDAAEKDYKDRLCKDKSPKYILLFRPFSTWRMASAILAEGGSSLGSTFHGHHDMLLSDDVIRKVHLGHYTFYSKSIVKRPKQCCIVEDIYAQGYIGGEGTRFFTGAGDKSFSEQWEQGNIGTRDVEADMFAWLVDEVPKGDVIDLTGHFDMSVEGRRNDSEEHFTGADSFCTLNGLHVLHPFRHVEDQYLQRVQNINTVMFRGKQLNHDGTVIKHHGTGHWGDEEIYDGCRKVRDGMMLTFKSPSK